MCKEEFTATGYICGCMEREYGKTFPMPEDCRYCGIIQKRECIGQISYPFPCTVCVSRYDWNVEESGVWTRKDLPRAA